VAGRRDRSIDRPGRPGPPHAPVPPRRCGRDPRPPHRQPGRRPRRPRTSSAHPGRPRRPRPPSPFRRACRASVWSTTPSLSPTACLPGPPTPHRCQQRGAHRPRHRGANGGPGPRTSPRPRPPRPRRLSWTSIDATASWPPAPLGSPSAKSLRNRRPGAVA
jgi:hypothetical protein